MCYQFPTVFDSTHGYWTDHLLKYKQLLQIILEEFEICNAITF